MPAKLRLYYFTTERYALEAIRDQRLKIARLNELNDPFEFLSPKLEAPLRKPLRDAKERWHASHGLLCMSKRWTNPLLWGHYADKHKGIVLGFDVDPDVFAEIKYQEDRPVLPGVDMKKKRALTEDDLEIILWTKFRDWSYEEEFRWFLPLGDPDTVSGLHFQPWGDDLELREVIVGSLSPVTPERLDVVLGDMQDEVVTMRSRPAYETFRVVPDRRPSKWRQPKVRMLSPGSSTNRPRKS